MQSKSLNKIMKLIFSPTLLLVIWAGQALAQPTGAGLNSGDHPLMDRFPDSQLEAIVIVENANYELVLGALRRTRQQVMAENSLRLRGDVTKITYQVAPQFTADEVHEFFVEQIEEKGYDVLFSCAGRNCGSSNYWANDIFSNRILYGPERNQYFMALRVGDSAQPRAHISLYIITRVNRRIYAYLEIVEDKVSSGVVSTDYPDLLEALNAQGSVALPMVEFADDQQLAASTNLEPVMELLQNNSALRFYLVAHLAGNDPLDTLIQRSTDRAEVLRQALIERGIEAGRIEARGVGPLAPACNISNCAERVELVLQ